MTVLMSLDRTKRMSTVKIKKERYQNMNVSQYICITRRSKEDNMYRNQNIYISQQDKTSIAHWVKNPLRRTSEHNLRHNYLNFSFIHLK